jgi:hypothetical protein
MVGAWLHGTQKRIAGRGGGHTAFSPITHSLRASAIFAVSAVQIVFLLASLSAFPAPASSVPDFHHDIRPILEQYCFDCHADGANKGGVAFDSFKSDKDLLEDRDLWWRALKNLRAGIMPPLKKPQPSSAEKDKIALWMKRVVFESNPASPDPGRVTIRRLNRTEYRNTIHDLLGVEFDTRGAFPPDETGHGFDNIGSVLTLSPMLLEKYVLAANKIIADTQEHWTDPTTHEKFFPRKIPADAAGRRAYARELLGAFARKAFRQPVDDKTTERLVAMAESVYSQPGKTFEAGIAQSMVAVIASPRMLFLEEKADNASDRYPSVDEFTLASRLSYFLWSTMPDDELMRLAESGTLRKNLPAQIQRMLEDKRSKSLVRNFTGQWLRARDIESVPIEARTVLQRERRFDADFDRTRKRFRELRDKSESELSDAEKAELATLRSEFRRRFERAPAVEMTGEVRRAMRAETEKVFEYILREDRSLQELLDSDYTFLNERLAKHYGLTNLNVRGDEMQLVKLPPGSPRGGVLGQGTILAVTSNPTRTSPVKRGLFILDSLLGTPPPPPPPNIPPLEDAARNTSNGPPSLRETLALHRNKPLCSSCHDRMDPLGLAMDNFNAMGMWRESEFGQPIDSAGKLVTGEEFTDVRGLKAVLVKNHSRDFYRTVTEKMLIYAVGRGLEYYDVETVDQIVARLETAGGRPSALIRGIIDSAPFQKMRPSNGNLTASSHE